jgi:hypothetical protein
MDLRLRGCGTRVIDGLFFKFLEDKDRRFKTNFTFSLILRFNLNLGGYFIWSASLTAPHIKEDLKNTWDMSTSQPRCSQESTRKTTSRSKFGRTRRHLHKYLEGCSTRLRRLGGLAGIDPRVPSRKLLARKEEVRLLLGFLCNPTRTLPCNPPTL